MKFFTASDFVNEGEDKWEKPCLIKPYEAADRANAKLEREACLMYKIENKQWVHRDDIYPFGKETHKALLIAIEPLERCSHPTEKVKVVINYSLNNYYKCECGAKVKPASFEVIND